MHTRLQLARQTGSQGTALEEVKAQLVDASAPRGVWLDAADRTLTLPELREVPGLRKMVLLNRSRLSVQPVTPAEWKIILALTR